MKTHPLTARLLTATGLFLLSGTLSVARPQRLYDGRTLDQWREAIQELDYRSPSRADAVPGLRAIVNDAAAPWFTRRQAALTLGRIGAPASASVSDLIRLLDEPPEPVETSPPLWSFKALALFGPLAADAAPNAIRVLSDPESPIILRLTATETLARIGLASNAGIQTLIRGAAGEWETVSDSDQVELRIACLEGLQLSAPPSAVPMLIATCSDSAERIRHAAAATLGALGARAEPAADVLGALVVFDETPVVRETAARSVANLGTQGMQVLARLLENADDEVVLYALDAAGRTSDRSRELGPALRRLFASENSVVSIRAMAAWWLVTRDARPILEKLVQALNSEDREVRKVASDTLMLMGGAALAARDDLEQIARDGTPAAQSAARRVLRVVPADDEGSG
ncbi:HEAT repeat protein [Caulifigura coniformis]|uniref:HEAT repeat protein n=1 Tax=Caulifigura coniformis TaxID=2527983 RepID=A0A517SBC4_9PLAN|nr:HEAT repeat domain-containing protein [Caulifigura coniformis]QDT53386.1 HEAT repeat protein [Caulifigura coniformis]